MSEVRRMRISAIEEFPAIKAAVNDGIETGLHRLHTETTDPTYLEAQEYVIGHIKASLDRLFEPPRKACWSSLTDLEILELSKATCIYGSDNHHEVMEFVAQIEARLRRKNT
jgi:hypothetical protein